MEKLGIGIIGCGNISAAYLRLAPMFKGLEVRAVADMNMANAEARALRRASMPIPKSRWC